METVMVQQQRQRQMQHVTLRLTVSRKEAARELQAAVKIGQAIRGQRIREMRDLDEARREKQEWVQRTMEALAALVTTEAWAEQFNDFVPTILPEYAEFGMFVDVFEDEMRHRLGRLHAFLKALNELPEPSAQPEPQAHPEIAQVLDRAMQQQPDAVFTDPQGDGGGGGGGGGGDGEDGHAGDDDQPIFDQSPLETLYVPPEAKMVQQQQRQNTQQTVAASILHEPSETPRLGHPPASAALTRGALIVRTNDEPAAKGIAEFTAKLGLTLRVIDRRSPNGHSMMDELNSQSGSRFVLMLVDPNNAGPSAPEDLFDLGCCVGRMGPDRVFALHRGGDSATDRFGIAHVPLDDTEGWQLQLARLLKKAGVSVDLNKLV